MTPPPAPPRAFSRALAAAATLLVLAAPAAAETPERGDFDARPTGTDAAPPRAEAARDALRERLGTFGLVSEEKRTGTARAVAKLDGFLTGPSGREGTRVALDYVRANPRVFGLDGDDVADLRLVDRTFTGGVEYLRWEQRFRGIPSSDTQLAAAVTGAGRLVSVTGPAAADLAVPSIAPAVSAERAYAAARRSGRAARPEVAVRERGGGAEQTTTFADGGTASLVLYQDGDGARLAWRVLAPVSPTELYDATVDATSGAVVRRTNRVDFAGDALVYPVNPTSPAEPVSLSGWLEGTTALKGPNVHAFVDPKDRVGFGSYAVADEDEVRPLPDGNWTFPLLTGFPDNGCAPAACTWNHAQPDSWEANRKQSATQLFYLVNTFLSHLAQQPINFVAGGFSGNDRVLAQAMDGADGPAAQGAPDDDHVNNASFLTLPDGTPALLQSHLFSHDRPEFGDFDAANDASVIYHEVTHGLSNRLVVDAQGFGALNTAQAGAIGEGTSDYYAMDFLATGSDGPAAQFRVGEYLDHGNPDGLRYQAIDCDPGAAGDPLCHATFGTAPGGFSYADFGNVYPGPEVHSDGEIWAQTLWDLRQVLGVDPARRVITGALRIAPPEPSFLDMRNAILALSADQAQEDAIWGVFAARGMGYYASTDGSTDTQPDADDSLPQAGEPAEVTGSVIDEEGNAVAGARVGVAGHDTRDRSGGELGPTLAEATDADGFYRILAPPGDYPLVVARKAGFRDDRKALVLPPTGATLAFALERDWSSAVNHATIEAVTGPDNTSSGCGPGGLIDDQLGSVWGSDNVPGGQRIVIDLGAPIKLAGVEIDPGAGCGDDATAGLGAFALSGSLAPDRDFTQIASGAFGANSGGALREVSGTSGKVVRYLELHAKAPQSTSGSGAQYLDVAEIHIAKQSGAQPGPSTETEAAQSVLTRTARLKGSVIPHAGAVTTRFQYMAATDASWSTIASASVATNDDAVPVTRDVGGLQPATTYQYRLVATRGGVDYPGRTLTFTTGPAIVPTPTPTPTATPTPTPTPPPDDGPVVSTSFKSKRLTADRRGMFKVQWTFGDAAPAGKASVRVIGKHRKRIASAAVAVQPGRTITKTMRLTRAGRKMIKRGRSLKVTLELRLPGGGTLRERVRLARTR